ncbi:MAG: sigma-54-dependent Fis family transcriptional regulator [Proteobacteria bacterium]|nr:sigma-54-dependent Fis family transcriptional regulator [Pseudomonadota bacterium]
MAQSILIVEDDPAQLRYIDTVVRSLGYATNAATDGEAAVERLLDEGKEPFDLVLLDLVLPGIDGVQVLEKVKPARPQLPVIMLTMQGGVGTVVKAMRAGASDFMIKPVSRERLQVSIENALKLQTLSGELSRMSRRLTGELGFTDLIYESGEMAAVIDLARRAGGSNIPILIEGESGVGKELVARAIQGTGERAGKAFVTVNCGALPENLVESILFGHEKGSFTGALEKHIGRFQEASGGTIFLDEVGELTPDIQVKLLRALQQGEIDPVGSNRPIMVDFRLISATNRDLAALVEQGKFREDLYYRLNVFPVHIPPLRERPADIEPLVDYFVSRSAASEGKPIRGITPEALDLLKDFSWPGNVRQLENAIFRGIVLCDEDLLGVADFPQIAQRLGVQIPPPPATGEHGAPAGPREAIRALDALGAVRPLKDVEEELIRLAIDHNNGHMSKVAKQLGIGRSTLYRKIRDLGLEVERA